MFVGEIGAEVVTEIGAVGNAVGGIVADVGATGACVRAIGKEVVEIELEGGAMGAGVWRINVGTGAVTDVYVEILTRTDRPKRSLLSETDSNSKTSQATLSTPFNNISDTRLYKLTQTLKQRLMNRLV